MTARPHLNPTGRFSDRVEDYVRYRPSYPAVAVDHVLTGLGEPAHLRAADVGAGTGIWTALLAARGVRVQAVEPNAAMRGAAPVLPGVEWLPGTAEATGLPESSVRLVTVAQAFHWFEPEKALREFRRVLAADGRLALIWNRRDKNDAFSKGYRDAILEVEGESSVERMDFDPALLTAEDEFTVPVAVRFLHVQELDRAGLHGRARSASYVPKRGARAHRLIDMLDTLFDRYHDARGLVTLRYACEVWTADPVRG